MDISDLDKKLAEFRHLKSLIEGIFKLKKELMFLDRLKCLSNFN